MNRLRVHIFLPGKAATLLLLLVGVSSFAVADGHSIAGHSPAGHFPAEDWVVASAEEVNLDQSKIDRLFNMTFADDATLGAAFLKVGA